MLRLNCERDAHHQADEAFRARDIQTGAHERLRPGRPESPRAAHRPVEQPHIGDAGGPELLTAPLRCSSGFPTNKTRVRAPLSGAAPHLRNTRSSGAATHTMADHQVIAAARSGVQRRVDGLAFDSGDQHGWRLSVDREPVGDDHHGNPQR